MDKKSSAASSFAVEPFRNPKEIIAIKNMLKSNPRDEFLFILGINTWLPVSALLGLKIKDIANVQPGDSVPVKGGERDVLYVNKTIHKAIQDYMRYLRKSPDINVQDFLFYSRKGGKPLRVDTVNSMVKRWAQDAGVKGVFGAQSLRKTCGYHHWIDPEADHECISQTFGHSSASLTKRFLGVNKEGKQKKSNQVVVELDDVFLRNTDDPLFKAQSHEGGGSEQAWISIMNLIAGQTADMFRLTDKNGINIYASPSHFEYLGYTAEERIGKLGLDIVHPDDIDVIMQGLHELGLDPDDQQVVVAYRTRHADGRYVWLETTFTYIADSDGSMKNLFQSARVIPVQKQSSWHLIKKTKHQYFPPRGVMGYTAKHKTKKAAGKKMIPGEKTDMLRILDIKGRNIYVSPSHLEATGYTVEERINTNNFEFIHPDDLSVIVSALNHGGRHREGPKNVMLCYRVRHKDGHYIWVETLNEFVVEQDGSVNTLVQFSRVIPERKQAEGRLTDVKMQHIARAFHEIIEWDKDKRLTIMNIRSMARKAK